MDMNIDMENGGMLDESFDMPPSAFDFQPAPPSVPEGNFFSQEIIGLGLQEPLPPDVMVEELYVINSETLCRVLMLVGIKYTSTESNLHCL
jgi:hypothetical protein